VRTTGEEITVLKKTMPAAAPADSAAVALTAGTEGQCSPRHQTHS
jgi:hypothetical protein